MEDKEENCLICLEKISTKLSNLTGDCALMDALNNVKCNTCKKEFHSYCLEKWNELNTKCPCCRSNNYQITKLICREVTDIFQIYQYKNLVELICSNKYIDGIPNININLEKLYCHHTRMTEIPNKFINLRVLCCSYSNVCMIPKELIKLKILDCSNTIISNIPDTLTELEYLNCSNTYISNIPDKLTKLVYLDCSNTTISNMPDTLTELEYLDCFNTKVKNIPENFIKLRKLFLTKIRWGVLKKRYLINNPFREL